jgi:hypothetical protein
VIHIIVVPSLVAKLHCYFPLVVGIGVFEGIQQSIELVNVVFQQAWWELDQYTSSFVTNVIDHLHELYNVSGIKLHVFAMGYFAEQFEGEFELIVNG